MGRGFDWRYRDQRDELYVRITNLHSHNVIPDLA